MEAQATRGPKVRGTPGHLPEIPPMEGETAKREVKAPEQPHTIVEKNLIKDTHAEAVKRGDVIEAETVEDALKIANERNRAVLTPFGYVCPSIIRERR